MASEQKEQYKRFEYLISTAYPCGYPCKICPIRNTCFIETENGSENSTCEERLWKYINEGV